jgi:UTP--glucose-1-phosphate uridylyltransferase
MNKQVRKAVIPVAGFGTRLLPVTKSVPKELLPLVDTPAIQVIVEECIASGIEEIVLITGKGKGAIEDHFDYNFELETALEARGKTAELNAVRGIGHMVRTISVRQKKPLGLGHAILCARDAIGDEPFLVLLPDDIIVSDVPVTRQMLDVYEQYGTGVVAVMDVPNAQVDRYGIVAGETWAEGLHRIRTLVEKPDPSFAPSNLAIIGRYLLPPIVFEYLSETKVGADGEIQLTDALGRLARERALIGYSFQGRRYDLGDKLGFLKANIAFGLGRKDIGDELRAFIRERMDNGEI